MIVGEESARAIETACAEQGVAVAKEVIIASEQGLQDLLSGILADADKIRIAKGKKTISDTEIKEVLANRGLPFELPLQEIRDEVSTLKENL